MVATIDHPADGNTGYLRVLDLDTDLATAATEGLGASWISTPR
ncbi:hypothetical protein [Nocardia tengchongensis]